jgi:Ca2+-binding RTX toxin-like protein
VVTENANEGTDTVISLLSYTLGANLENLMLLGAATVGVGNSLNNTITGNSLDNTLDGGTGVDRLIGGLGNDTYRVDNSLDVIVESTNQGLDAVISTVTYTLLANVENLTLTGINSTNGTGNTINNTIIGNSGNNTLTGLGGDDYLDGGAGADRLVGGIGNDTYLVDRLADVVVESSNQGIDLVRSSLVAYTLGANVENLILLGTGNHFGTGNTLKNTITGNSGNNTLTGLDSNDYLDGGAGADRLVGGIGNDTYVLDNAGDVVVESANQGIDPT